MNATRGFLTLACVVVAVCGAGTKADFMFGEPVSLSAIVMGDDRVGCVSYDGLEMYIISDRPGGQGSFDLWVVRRAATDDGWGPAENLGPAINTANTESGVSISADGLTLYFNSANHPGGFGGADLWMATRATRRDPWGNVAILEQPVNRGGTITDGQPWISPDGLELYFASLRSGGLGARDIWVARRATEKHPWVEPVNLGPVVNSSYHDMSPSLSPDGLLLLFCDYADPYRPGGYGNCDAWMTRRAGLSDPWQAPVNLGPVINGPGIERMPRISPDGRTLYFYSSRPGSPVIWQAPIIPILDFNDDGEVDDGDLLVMVEHWGQDYPRCDVGPYAWGDGVVDARDLAVLTQAAGGSAAALDPKPHASDVSCDAILSWMSPKFTPDHDVYFGTSPEEVGAAGRSDPLGVLVSLGQTATTYDPAGPLEFSRTYYWRIDEVGPAPDRTIHKGPVLDFTTESYAYPITSLTVKASSQQSTSPAIRTIDGSGLNADDQHGIETKQMWMSTGAVPAWIQYTFDRECKLTELWVWNANSPIEATMGFGVKDVTIECSTDGETWTAVENVPQFARGTGAATYTADTKVDLGEVVAKHVRLTVDDNWGSTTIASLSEVRFFAVPVRAGRPQPADEATEVGIDTALDWRPGREAEWHDVYFGADKAVVADGTAAVETVADHRYTPASIDFGTRYFWKVNEIDETRSYEGEVWSFTTQEYETVDDFESYDDLDNCIYDTWIDGLAGPAQGGSQVGYDVSPFAERTVVHGGGWCMPLRYDNAEMPFYSRAERAFAPSQDWTVHGADTLTLWFRGNPIDFLQLADGAIQMSGGGADIWDTSDQFRFAYRQLKGDGSIVAKIHSLTTTHAWAKAGVMVRGSLDPASAYAFMSPTPDGRRAFQTRVAPAGTAMSVHSNVGIVRLPLWLKLQRTGSEVTGYYSTDGKSWIVNQPDNADTGSYGLNPASISIADDVYIGLAVTSHNISVPAVAEFSDVSFTGEVAEPWQVEAIGIEQPSNDPSPLYVSVEDEAGHVKTLTHPDPAAVQTIAWRQWLIPLSEFVAAGVDPTSTRKICIGVGDPNDPTVGGSGVIYIDDIAFGHPFSSR